MNTEFSNLRFNRPQRTISARVIWMGGLLVGVGLAWVALPPSTFFWLALLLIAALGWAASYGWRHAVRVLAAFLDRIQRL
jgi:hypothetical protein